MKSLAALWQVMANELAIQCHTSASRDIKTFTSRSEHEGDAFFTITLPQFAKDFERSLELGYVDSGLFVGFQRRGGPLPLFLGGFLRQVFEPRTGRILEQPSVESIFAVRQLTLVFGKILRPTSVRRERDTIRQYLETDRAVDAANSSIGDEYRERFRRVAALLFRDVFQELDNEIYHGLIHHPSPQGRVIARHGPGATADKLQGNQKWSQLEWTSRLEEYFPFGDHALPNWRYYDQLDDVTVLEPEDEYPARVVLVPKTQKSPRVIAIEPTAVQYMQQALLAPLVELLEGDPIVGCFKTADGRTSSLLGFTDQGPNQDLACEGSREQQLATLDLSEASDRVSTQHVADLVSRWPHLYGALMATRSTKAEVQGHGVIHLSKFASMGSAVCFPVEAMVFLTTVFLGIEDSLKRPVTRGDVKFLRERVRVYGDDIIVPTDFVFHVLKSLEAFGFKVNTSKSFWNGKFRESCGGDFYDGERVTPIRCRRDLPENSEDVQELISLVSFRNQLYYAGLWQTCRALDARLERLLRHFPRVESTSAILGRESFLPLPEAEMVSERTHTPMVKGWVVTSRSPSNMLDGWGALRKCLDPRRVNPFEDPRHLERSGRPDAVGMKLRWRPPF